MASFASDDRDLDRSVPEPATVRYTGPKISRDDCEDGPGHEWAPCGGGLLICVVCETERWER